MPASAPPGPRPRTKLAALFLAPVLGLLLAEGALRVLAVAPTPMPVRRGNLFERVRGAELEVLPRAGGRKVIEYFDGPGGTARSVRMQVNGQRFRGPEVERAKPPGTLRIACVGDSHTFGDGVPEGETWPDHLRALLRRELPGPVEVLNCGVNRYDTPEEALWLRDHVLPFEPDVVLLQYFINDAAAKERAGPPRRDRLLEWSDPRRAGWIGALRGRSRLADVVLDAVYRRRGLVNYADLRMAGYEPDSPGWRGVSAGLLDMRDRCAAGGITFAVVLYPFLVRDGEHLTSHAGFEVVKAFCAREGIPCFDAEPAFLDAPDLSALRVSPHDYHANGTAHERFARAVAACDTVSHTVARFHDRGVPHTTLSQDR